jgi:hypothetical protein
MDYEELDEGKMPQRRSGQRKSKSRTEIASLARAFTDTVIKVLVSLVTREDVPPMARIAAGKQLLERAWGRPTQTVHLHDDRPTPIVEIVTNLVDPRPNAGSVPQQPGRRLPNWDYDRYGDPDVRALPAPEASEAEAEPDGEPSPEYDAPNSAHSRESGNPESA